MLEQIQLARQFQTLLNSELQAERAYAELVGKLSDPDLREQVERLCRDKHRHVRMAERLLEMVE